MEIYSEMACNNYNLGANFERRFVTWLRERGWVSSRTPGSKGSYDVWAMRAGRGLLAQLRRHGRISQPELRELLNDASIAGAAPLLVWQRQPSGFHIVMVRGDLSTEPVLPSWFGGNGKCSPTPANG